jgi:hypothetical protein
MRVYEKKKRYRMHCREQTMSGKVTDPSSGAWVLASSCRTAAAKNVASGTAHRLMEP